MNDNGMSPADVAAVVGNTDRNNGFAYGYPVFPYGGGYGGGFGNAFGGDGSWIWFILILALFGGFNGNGNGFGGGFNNDYAWLSNGQKEIMQNTNQGFDTLQLANQLNGINSSVQGLSTQLCGCCGDIQNSLCNGFAGVNATVNSGFANAETAANARQMANMQQAFSNQLSTVQGFNNLSSDLASCCCENRLATQDLKATVISENCADREALSNGIRDIITNQNNAVQRVLDQLCQDKIDSKNEKIDDLNRQILMKDLQASQVAQTADLRANNAVVANQLVSELRSCPIPSQPVYRKSTNFYLQWKQLMRMRMWKYIRKYNSIIAKCLYRQTLMRTC